MKPDRNRKDLATEWIFATETIKTASDKLSALAWLKREHQRWERRTGRDSMVIITRGEGAKKQYALAYAGLFKGGDGEEVVEE